MRLCVLCRPLCVLVGAGWLLAWPGCGAVSVQAQTAAKTEPAPSYDPRLTFAPLTLPDAVNVYRSSNGAPGPGYWQNEADYELHAELDTKAKQLAATETITYTNNSPDRADQPLGAAGSEHLPLRLAGAPGEWRRAAWTAALHGNGGRRSSTEGFVLESVEIEAGKEKIKADCLVTDTRLQVKLPEPLRPRGGQLQLHIRYHYTIPGEWGGRTSWGASKQGDIYDMAQWYPRMAVYDDLRGWDTLPYIGSEFYLEYGHFDYS